MFYVINKCMINFNKDLFRLLVYVFVIGIIQIGNGQSDFFNIIYDSQKQYHANKDIESIHELIYELQIGHEKTPDTIVALEGVEHKYQLKENNIHRYFPGDSVEITGYDGDGVLSFNGIKKYNENGTLAFEQMDFVLPYMKPLSFSKYYTFSETGKLLEVINQSCDSCEIQDKFLVTYDENDVIQEVMIQKPDIGTVTHSRITIEDTLRYTANYDLTDQYIKSLSRYGASIDDLTMEYVDVYTNTDGNRVYKGIRINDKSGLPEVKWINVRDENHNIIEFTHFKEGKRVQKRTFKLNNKGNVISYININSKGNIEEYQNELTDEGEYKIQRVKKGTLNYKYNDRGDWIKFTDEPSGVNYYREFKVRTIEYK